MSLIFTGFRCFFAKLDRDFADVAIFCLILLVFAKFDRNFAVGSLRSLNLTGFRWFSPDPPGIRGWLAEVADVPEFWLDFAGFR